MKPISGQPDSLMDQDSNSNPGTLSDSVLMPQIITIGPIEYSLRDDRAAEDRAVDERASDDNVTNCDYDCDTHVLILLSKDPTTEAKWLSEQGAQSLLEMGQCGNELPSGTVGSLTSNIRSMTPEVVFISTEEEESDTSNELWLDACQYLGEDENGGAILDKCGHSPDMGRAWPRFSADNKKVSDFPCGADTVIGQVGSDLDHLWPPVERWSSIDSWSSALSSWAVEEQVPEDLIAAFPTTQTATQGHPQLPMAIQDQMLEPSPSTENPILTGKNCFSTCPKISGKLPEAAQFQVRGRDNNQTTKLRDTPSAKGDKEPRDSQATQGDSPADTALFVGSPCGTHASEQYLFSAGSSSDRLFTGNYEAGTEIDTLSSSTEEDSESQYTFLEGEYTFVKKNKKESCSDVPGKVTEKDVVTQLASLVEGRGPGSYGSAISRSHFPCQEVTKVVRECVSGKEAEELTELHIPTHTQRSSLVTTDLQGKGSQVSLNTSSLQEESQEGTWGSPHFFMPLAPLSLGSTLFPRSNSALAGEQACAKSSFNGATGHNSPCIEPRELWLSFGGNTDKLNLDNHVNNLSGGHRGQLSTGSGWSLNKASLTYSGEKEVSFNNKATHAEELRDFGKELSNLVILTSDNLVVSEEDHLACVTLDLQDPLASSCKPFFKSATAGNRHCIVDPKKGQKMPHKSAKHSSEMKTRSKKDSSQQLAPQASKKSENQILGPNQSSSRQQENIGANEDQDDSLVTVIETIVITEKVAKAHGKKKKKHSQNATGKSEAAPLVEVEKGVKQKIAKAKNDVIEVKASAVSGQSKNPTTTCQKDNSETDHPQRQPQQPAVKHAPEGASNKGAGEPLSVAPKVPQNIVSLGQRSDDVIKRRRLSELKLGKHVVETKAPQCSVQARGEETKAPVESTRKKAYSDAVKQNVHRNVEVPRVVQPIQAGPVSEDPQSLCLWCQFSAVFTDHTVTWTKDSTTLAEVHRSAGDESRVSVTLSKASNKDLGRYQCSLRSPDGSASLEYLLTYEVLSEIIILPQRNIPAAPAEVVGEEEEIKCSRLLFHEDFLCDQYFADDQSASIVTEKVHFGEGMHRRAFRTKMQAGMVSVFMPGHPCVLKVHNAISYGTKNNEELVQKNYNLAVEECHVQNTAREYIKAYTVVAQAKETFGDVPEIIPIYLVHRPSNDIPYATLEEELLGDFVKYSVRDGKEINLMRRDSEAGQKCCAFQHWVYHKTEGNLLVTDMQGVGMRLTDVGIATCKKGYRGFRGNCATSFIDQFKVLHMCNKYCELLGLKSLQPKPKKAVSAPKPKAHPAPKKKTFGPTVKGKS